jgi:hypothetical protein
MSQGLVLFDPVSSGLFPGQTCPRGCAALGFPCLLGAIENCFNSCYLNFMCTLCFGGYLVG